MLVKHSTKVLIRFLIMIKKEEPVTIKKEEQVRTGASSLVYDKRYSFSKCRNDDKYYNLSFTTKHDILRPFCHRLNDFRNLVPQKEKNKN